MFNKSTESAFAAMTFLAEYYNEAKTPYTAAAIAQERNLQRPFLAKILVQLAAAGLIKGTPGPRGGYYLARPPNRIKLLDIAICFERNEAILPCPFGLHQCRKKKRCPMHDQFVKLQENVKTFLADNTLAVFT